jgi:hypothetical protein
VRSRFSHDQVLAKARLSDPELAALRLVHDRHELGDAQRPHRECPGGGQVVARLGTAIGLHNSRDRWQS